MSSSAAALRRLAARAAATAARHALPRVAATSGGVLTESATKASSAAGSPFRTALRGFAAEAAPVSAAASGVATGKVTKVRRDGKTSRRELFAQREGGNERRGSKKIGDDWKKERSCLQWLLCLLSGGPFIDAKDALLSSSLGAKARFAMQIVA